MSKSVFRCLVAFALSLTGALSGCATSQKCSPEECLSDAQISAKIEAQLAKNPDIEPNAITVQTLDHTVYLYGLVASGLEIDEAKSLASNVRSVTEVVSSVAVSK